MPRGVPASGKRQPRVFAEPLVEASMAGSAVDGQVRVDSPAEEEAVVEDGPAGDDLIIEQMVEVIGAPAEVELTADQREIKRLRDELARARGKRDEEPEVVPVANPGDDTNILIHFLEDGLTALGRVWYRGEELEFEVGSQPYKDTQNRLGQSWLDLRFDEFGQVERFGKIMFRNGPWPGKTYLDGTFESLRAEKDGTMVSAPSEDELAAAEKARRKRAAPRLPAQV